MRGRMAAVLTIAFLLAAPGHAQQGARGGEWRWHSGDLGKHEILAARSDQQGQCRAATRRLAAPGRRPELSAKMPDFSFSRDFRATPLMIEGTLFSPERHRPRRGVQPSTGKTVWVQQPFADEPDRVCGRQHAQRRLLDGQGAERRIFVIRGEYLDRARCPHGRTGRDLG